MTESFIRCKKCRATIVARDEKPAVVNCHNEPVFSDGDEFRDTSCMGMDNQTLFIKEECMPRWMEPFVQEAGWTKGRINCPTTSCQARIGSFDFVTGQKCPCQTSVLPPLRIVVSKVDVMKTVLHTKT